MSAPRRAKQSNRYYDEFRTAILSELGNIQSYCFTYTDSTSEPSINAIILMQETATAAGIKTLMHQLQYAFTDIDNTSFTVTKDSAAFAALAAQCGEAYDDDDDVGEDDDDCELDGNDDDDHDEPNDDVEDDHYDYATALAAVTKYAMTLLSICAPETLRPLAAHNIAVLDSNRMRSIILPCLNGVEQVIRRCQGRALTAITPLPITTAANDHANNENADDEVDDDDDDDVALNIEVGYARPYSDAERSKFHRVE
jgi:hypothetical protein